MPARAVTLAHLVSQQIDILARCPACGSSASIPSGSLAAQLGDTLPVDELERQMNCTRCGSADVTVGVQLPRREVMRRYADVPPGPEIFRVRPVGDERRRRRSVLRRRVDRRERMLVLIATAMALVLFVTMIRHILGS